MKKYKLIKEYSGSPDLGATIVETMIIGNRPKFKTFTISGHDKNYDGEKFRVDNPEISPEYWEEVVEKDYEILSFKENNKPFDRLWKADSQLKNCYCLQDGKTPFHNSETLIALGLDIYSVRRLSDSKVFTVGDRVCNPDFSSWVINNFNSSYGKMSVYKFDGGQCPSFERLQHYKEPLFTTEDGVDIFKGDDLFLLGTNTWLCTSISPVRDLKCHPFKGVTGNEFKYFSTKEKAEEYILMNKPCLSINDILSVSVNTHSPFGFISLTTENLITIIKNK